jgi:nitroimidazol reductase NimA-like FMN-containing flavoprotein (pyridoxamine 5'-phosphate oxidase superfamily)
VNRRTAPHPDVPIRAASRDPHGITELDDASCVRRLGAEAVGRLGFSAGGLPVIHPVNYFLDDRTIVFRTEPGEKQRAAANGSVACLQIDHFDTLGHEGWSILATGRLKLAPPERVERLARLPLTPWAFPDAACFVELPIELISGRAIDHRVR